MLEANGIKAVTMHGGMSQQKRVDLLNQFRFCDRNGARVLLISNVGSVGLNIACANILIIVVRSDDRERGSCEKLRDCNLGRAVVSADRATAHWTRLEVSAEKTSSHLSPDRREISGHILEQHLVWQGVHTRHVLECGQQAQ